MRFLLVLVLGGCNAVFGLDETALAEPDFDFDGDGSYNSRDNCPTVANPDQQDVDGDNLGDACDPCPEGPEARADVDADGTDDACDPCLRGPQHDEDGDGVMDACDGCPQVFDPAQANGDADDLGDACDGDPGMQRRVLFDGFATIAPAWRSLDPWIASADAAAPVAITPATKLLWNPEHATSRDNWHMEVGFVVPTNQMPAFIGVQGAAVPSHGLITGCTLHSRPDLGLGMWEMAGISISSPFAVSGPVRLRMGARYMPAISQRELTCELVGVPGARSSITLGYTQVATALEITTQTTPITFADYVEDP